MRLAERIFDIFTRPTPIRLLVIRRLLAKYPIGPFETRLRVGAFIRPWYAWCLFYAAVEAKLLGIPEITAIEFGVAGGNGLLCLCDYAAQVERETGVSIRLFGFDAGTGLPESRDPRDILYCWPAGSFAMDEAKLRAKLPGHASLILGNVADTVQQFKSPSPIGAVLFDLDLYTSTRDALAVFECCPLLPRVCCYFDNIVGAASNAYSDLTGERAAIKHFNEERPEGGHLSEAYAFDGAVPESWHQKMFILHEMKNPDYSLCLSDHKHTLDLI